MDSNKIVITLISLAVIALGVWLFLSQGGQIPYPGGEEEIAPADTEEPVTGTEEGGIREVAIEGSEYSFEPQSISLGVGERVRVAFRNTGTIAHNFTIEGIGATRTIPPGETDILEFTAPMAETILRFNSLCTVPGHAELGMIGAVLVQ